LAVGATLNSNISGINMFTFSEDRKRIKSVLVYRVPLAEDVTELEENEREHSSPTEIHLRRLVFD
jgi:hypothetical protein